VKLSPCHILCAILLPVCALSALAQLEVLPHDAVPMVFCGEARRLQVLFCNPSDQDVTVPLSTKLLQASSATTMPVGDAQLWKPLRVLAGQTIVESVTLNFPSVKTGTRFIVQWLDNRGKQVGTIDVVVQPPDLLKGLQPLLSEKPLGVFDPENQLKPLLKSAKQEHDDLEETGWEGFSGKLVLVGPFAGRKQMPGSLDEKIKTLAQRGVGVVWMQPPSLRHAKLETSDYLVRRGAGSVVVATAKSVAGLAQDPAAQLNLLRLARLVANAEPLDLPQLKP